MRVILYLGKGGVGKTTVAAATAARASELGQRSLVVSTDIAHSLGDVLGVELGHRPQSVADRLEAQEINVLEDLRDYWGQIHLYLAGMLRRRGVDDVIAEEMATIPGMDEVVALLHLWQSASAGAYDLLVIDAAPTGETIRLLSMPETFEWYATRVGGWNTGAMRVAGSLVRGVLPEADFFGLLSALQGDLSSMREVLLDPERSSCRLVVNPERMVIREAQRAETHLNLFGYPVDAVICNRVTPSDGEVDSFRRQVIDAERRNLDLIGECFGELPVFSVARHPEEITGVAKLAALGREIFGAADPSTVFHRGPTQRVRRLPGGDYELWIPMPNVEADRVGLTKRNDVLIIEVGNIKRDLLLPRALADRDASDAEVGPDGLRVRFTTPARAAAR
ncbi:MAG: ArsA family ATPase [Candidatus Dormibacteria bacterium]